MINEITKEDLVILENEFNELNNLLFNTKEEYNGMDQWEHTSAQFHIMYDKIECLNKQVIKAKVILTLAKQYCINVNY